MLHLSSNPNGFGLFSFKVETNADVAELADAPDLGSGVHDVQVQVLSSAVRNGRRCLNTAFPTAFFIL